MLAGQIALVTGASRGIGRAIALELARHGATVAGTATTTSGAQAISDYLTAAGAKGAGFTLNVNDPSQCDALVDALQKQYGDITLLINNAGITRDNLLMRMKEEEWDDILSTNLKAVFRLSRLVVRSMMKARAGRIINIGSVVGSMGNAGQTNYAAAKARELNDAQRATLVGQIPLARLGSVDDIAGTVAFLASPAAAYITGATIHVNGGMYME